MMELVAAITHRAAVIRRPMPAGIGPGVVVMINRAVVIIVVMVVWIRASRNPQHLSGPDVVAIAQAIGSTDGVRIYPIPPTDGRECFSIPYPVPKAT